MNNVFESQNVDLYHLLGLAAGESNQILIKKNFSDLIKIFHSDRGGDSRFHQQIVEAYRILSDPSRKFIYDNFGLFGVYAIKENDELLKIFSDVSNSPHLTIQEKVIIKNYVSNKIKSKLNEIITNSNEINYHNSDVTTNLSTGLFDYLYLINLNENNKIFLAKYLNFNKISFDNNFSIYKSNDNNREVQIGINYNTDQRNYNSQINYNLELNNRIQIPFGMKIFDQDFISNRISIDRIITSDFHDIHIKKSFTLFNFLYLPLNFTINPVFSLAEKRLAGLDLNFNYSHSNSISSNTKIDLMNKTFDLNVNFKKNKQKLITFLSLSEDKFSIGIYHTQNFNNKYVQSKSIFLRNNGLFLTNEWVVHFNNFALRFASNVLLARNENKNNYKFNSHLTIGLQFGSFKINFPIVISNENNLISHSFILISAIFGNLTLFIKKRLKNKNSQKTKILNKLNFEKQKEFNNKNKENFERKIIREKNNNGIIIKFAFFGEFEKISYTYKSLLLFGEYKNEDDRIFDVKVPIMMHIVNSKLNLPYNLLDVEGVFIPDYDKKDNLALVVMYNYNYNLYTVIVENKKMEVSLP